MKIFIIVCIYLIPFSVIAQDRIVMGKADSLYSTILQENRNIWVYHPNEEGNEKYEKQIYPVVYLLDGEVENFNAVVTMIQQLSFVNGNTVCPEMIVVGIRNTDRLRDLTPTHMNAQPPSGGGTKFMSFIEKELMPYINSTYQTAPYKIFIGHSIGGLTVINTLVHNKSLFNAYIAIDPAMWWDDQKVLKQAEKALKATLYSSTTLYLGVANTMDIKMDTSKVKHDTDFSTLHIRSNLKLASFLDSNKQNKLKGRWKYYNEDDHSSVPLITEYDGLRFVFNDYDVKILDKYLSDSSIKLDSVLSGKYSKASEVMGYTVKPPGNTVDGLATYMTSLQQFHKAKALFEMNKRNYPDNYKVYKAAGDFYYVRGDNANAISNYKKVLTLKKDTEIKKKLETLLHK